MHVAERVVVLSASVGAGHDAAAEELSHRLRQTGVAVEVHDFLDALPRWLRFVIREGYTRTVNHTPWFYDWLYAAMEHRGIVQGIGLLVCWWARRRVLQWCADADAVVSTYPLASQSLGQLVRCGRVSVPTTTFLTDPSVHALWVHPHIARHLTTMTATATIAEQSYDVLATAAGPLVPSRFDRCLPEKRRRELARELGVDHRSPLALVVTGSLGLGRVEETVDAILATGRATPLVLCGRNEGLLEELSARPGVLAVGWRDDVHELMRLCDVMVHNAGGMSFSESLVAGLPAVTFRCIPGHGRANGEVLAEAGVAPLADTVEELADGLDRQLRPAARAVVRGVCSRIEQDAAEVVLGDLRAARAAQAPAVSPRDRPGLVRTGRGRRVAAGVAAVAVLVSVGTTEGVSAAARHGFGVESLPPRSVALVVAPTRLEAVVGRGSELARSRAAVLVPPRLSAQDVAAARQLSAAGVPLVVRPCAASTLLHDIGRQLCGPAGVLAENHVGVLRTTLASHDVEGVDLVVASRDGTTVLPADMLATRAVPTAGVWVLRPGAVESGGTLVARAAGAARAASADGLVVRSVASAHRRR